MSTTGPGVSSYAFDRRDAARQRAASLEVKVVSANGFVQAAGAGEGLVDVVFPNWYVEKPAISFGGELANQSPVAGKFPTVSVVVTSWSTQDRNFNTYYLGATLAVVTTGPPDQVLIVHWQAEGKALSAPGDIGPTNATGNA
jgi:hypothetical protein